MDRRCLCQLDIWRIGIGKVIYKDLVRHLGKEHVFDLNTCQNDNMPEDMLMEYAFDPHVRLIVACGGDAWNMWLDSIVY